MTFPFPFMPPGRVETAVPGGTGSAIGNMTVVGGLAASFNGTTTENSGAGSVRANQDTAFIGKDWTTTKTISKADLYPCQSGGANGEGFFENRTTVEIQIRGDSSAPSAGSEGTLLGTTGSFSDGLVMKTVTIASPTAFRYVWAYLSGSGGSLGSVLMAEVVFYELA